MIAQIALRGIHDLPVPLHPTPEHPSISVAWNSQANEKKACSKCGENSQNTLFRVFRPLVQKILGTPYRDGASVLAYAPILPVVRVPVQAGASESLNRDISVTKFPTDGRVKTTKCRAINVERLVTTHLWCVGEHAQ